MKIILSSTLRTLALAFALAASVHSAPAIAPHLYLAHTYVSSAGSDTNPCSRTAPCATFTGALANTSPGGVITALNAADYGHVTISQAVTIDGTGTEASIVTNTVSDSITINGASSDTVILRHLTLTGLSGSNNGVRLNSGNMVVDDCKISGFVTNEGLNLASSGTTLVENTTITGCSEGVGSGGSGLLSLRNVTLQGNSNGMVIAGGPTDISHSQITQNTNIGLYAFQSTVSVSDCMISGNGTAVFADTSATIRLINNDILNNTTGITTNGIVSSTGDNRKAGNTTSGNTTPGKVITQQ